MRPTDANSSKQGLALTAALFTVLAWACAFPLIRIAMRQLSPLSLASARYAVAGTIAATWLLWRRPHLPSARDALRYLLCSLIGIAAFNGFLNAGERSVTAAAASFIVNCVPILTAVLATAFLGERLSLIGWTGSAVGLVGVGLIGTAQPGGLHFGADVSLVFAAAVSQAIYFVIQRPLVRRYGPLTSTAYTMIGAAILLGPWLFGAGTQLAAPNAVPATLVAVAALGAIPAALGYASWSVALDHYGATRASNFLYLVPIVATVLGVIMAGEIPAPSTLIGGGIAILGVLIVNKWGRAAVWQLAE